MAARKDTQQHPPPPSSPYAFGTDLVDEVSSLAQLQLDANDAGDLLGALPADLYLDTPPGSLAPASHMAAAAQYGTPTYQEAPLWGGVWEQSSYAAPGLFGVQSPLAEQTPMGDGALGGMQQQPFVQTHRQPDWSVGR